MALSFQKVTLEGNAPDHEGALVFRDGQLVALLTRLSDLHAELEGRWFVEAVFGKVPSVNAPLFDSTEHFGEWLTAVG